MRKKVLIAVLCALSAICVCLGLAACGNSTGSGTGSSTGTGANNSSANSNSSNNSSNNSGTNSNSGTTYTVTFVADDTTVATISYSEGATSINEPDVPEKVGYGGYWESYTLSGNITVNATYETQVIYTLDSGTYSVTGLRKSIYTDITILDEYEGKAVTTIASSAFKECTSLKSVTIGDNVTLIDSQAFNGCSALENVIIGDSVTEISNAFLRCTSLKEITIPDSVTTLGSAFRECTALEKVTIGKGIKEFGDSVFYGCTALTEINYNAVAADDINDESSLSTNESLYMTDQNYIFYNAGQSGVGITVNIGADVTRIPSYLFCPHTSYSNVSPKIIAVNFASNSKCETIGKAAFYKQNTLTSITLPDSVTTICDYAFYSSSLSSITLGSGVTSIGADAFRECESLTSITITENVVSIGDYAFRKCTALKSVTGGNKITILSKGVFMNDTALTDITLYEGLSILEDKVFYGCSSFTSIDLPDSLTTIGSSVFSGCTSLKNIVIPNTVNSVGSQAFYGCTYLETAVIGSGVTDLPTQMFCGCSSLTTIIILGKLNTVTNYSISEDCSSLSTIYYIGSSKPSITGTLNTKLKNATWYFYSETQPTDTEGNYWHYDENGEITVWTVSA